MNKLEGIFFWSLLFIYFVIIACIAKGSDFSGGDVDYLGMQYRSHRNYRDPYFQKYETVEGECTGSNPDGSKSTECMKYGADILFDLDLFSYKKQGLKWKNDVGMDATNKQVRHVDWEWELGLFTKKLDVFYHHHSRHVLEDKMDYRYPLRDEYIIRFNIIGTKK